MLESLKTRLASLGRQSTLGGSWIGRLCSLLIGSGPVGDSLESAARAAVS